MDATVDPPASTTRRGGGATQVSPQADPGLTDDEHRAVRLAGELYTLIAERIVGSGPTREDDLSELRGHIHGIQHAVMAQVVGRLHPGRYRLLGQILDLHQASVDDGVERTDSSRTSS